MNEEDALLAAICAHPDEDTPRLAFADWLSERGGPVNTAWANGIRAQVRLAAGDPDPTLPGRTKVFETAYGYARLVERLRVPGGVVPLGPWVRGFPDGVSGPVATVREHWPALRNRIPCRRLLLEGIGDEGVADFVGWPGLDRLRSLSLHTMIFARALALGEAGVTFLARCPALAGLEWLSLAYLDVTDRVAERILDSAHLAGLRHLTLMAFEDGRNLSPEVAARLTARFGEHVFR